MNDTMNIKMRSCITPFFRFSVGTHKVYDDVTLVVLKQR